MTEIPDLEGRITELETRIALQDETIRDLSDMVARQWSLIEAQAARIEDMQDRFATALEDRADPAEEPPPPHY